MCVCVCPFHFPRRWLVALLFPSWRTKGAGPVQFQWKFETSSKNSIRPYPVYGAHLIDFHPSNPSFIIIIFPLFIFRQQISLSFILFYFFLKLSGWMCVFHIPAYRFIYFLILLFFKIIIKLFLFLLLSPFLLLLSGPLWLLLPPPYPSLSPREHQIHPIYSSNFEIFHRDLEIVE